MKAIDSLNHHRDLICGIGGISSVDSSTSNKSISSSKSSNNNISRVIMNIQVPINNIVVYQVIVLVYPCYVSQRTVSMPILKNKPSIVMSRTTILNECENETNSDMNMSSHTKLMANCHIAIFATFNCRSFKYKTIGVRGVVIVLQQ